MKKKTKKRKDDELVTLFKSLIAKNEIKLKKKIDL